MAKIAEWAIKRANVLASAERGDRMASGGDYLNGFARYIMEREEPPVDPLLIEARRLGAEYCPAANKRYETGELDDHASTKALVAALHRGIELGKAGEA